MQFIYLSCLIIIAAVSASIYQHYIIKQPKRPKWILNLHYLAFFSGCYITIELFNSNAFLFFLTVIACSVKLIDVLKKPVTNDKESALITEFSKEVWLFALIIWAFRTFIFDYSPIPSGSMEPTLVAGDLIAVNKMAYSIKIPPFKKPLYQFNQPTYGDVIIFNPPMDPNSFYIKRVIACGGDRVEYRNKQYFVNGKPYIQANKSLNFSADYAPLLAVIDETIGHKTHKIQLDDRQFNDPIDIIVPLNHYFVSGDNRDFSLDSRSFGPISINYVIGKAEMVLMQFKLPTIFSFERSGPIT